MRKHHRAGSTGLETEFGGPLAHLIPVTLGQQLPLSGASISPRAMRRLEAVAQSLRQLRRSTMLSPGVPQACLLLCVPLQSPKPQAHCQTLRKQMVTAWAASAL